MTAKIGSTNPEIYPIMKLFFFDNPSLLKGIDVANPSGILFSVNAKTKRVLLLNDVLIPSASLMGA
jgi:hypothetical protein